MIFSYVVSEFTNIQVHTWHSNREQQFVDHTELLRAGIHVARHRTDRAVILLFDNFKRFLVKVGNDSNTSIVL